MVFNYLSPEKLPVDKMFYVVSDTEHIWIGKKTSNIRQQNAMSCIDE
jgi:hypothetical protein